MAAVQCPYCRHSLNLKGDLRPGRYGPACPKCSGRFHLTVCDDTVSSPVVTEIKSEREKTRETVAATAAPVEMETAAGMKTGAVPAIDPAVTAAQPGTRPAAGADETVAQTTPLAEKPTAPPRTAGGDGATLDFSVGQGSETGPSGGVRPTLGGYRIVKELGAAGWGRSTSPVNSP